MYVQSNVQSCVLGGGGGSTGNASPVCHYTHLALSEIFLANCLLTPAGDGMHSGLKLVYVCMLVQQHLLHRVP